MVFYSCPRCLYETSHKATMRRHYSRKLKCKTIHSRKSIKDCLKELETNKKKSYDELERENKMLIECKTVVINNNITNNIDNSKNITNIDNSKNITINSYNQTDIDVLKDDVEKLKIKNKKDEEVILSLLEMIHLNDKYPQNHNLYIENCNLKRMMKLEGDKFEEKGRGYKAIEDFIKTDVSQYFENSTFLGNSEINTIYESLMTKYENYDADDRKNKQRDNDNKSNLLHKFYELFYNGKELVKNTARDNGIKVK